jgi:hypothetical protein
MSRSTFVGVLAATLLFSLLGTEIAIATMREFPVIVAVPSGTPAINNSSSPF